MRRSHAALLVFLAVWALTVELLLLLTVWQQPVERAIVWMALGLLGLWVGLFGGLMLLFGRRLCAVAARLRIHWRLRFVLLATALALVEEAAAVLMTNLAPLLGDPSGQAAITASANYWEVVSRHSVVVFVPMFIAWALLLSWRSFSPFAVFLLFGLTGLLGEVIAFGPQNLLGGGFWILVYGLMVYLPACAVQPLKAPPARAWHVPLALLLPILASLPVVFLLNR